MTTLGNIPMGTKKGWRITKSVSGDLSYGYYLDNDEREISVHISGDPKALSEFIAWYKPEKTKGEIYKFVDKLIDKYRSGWLSESEAKPFLFYAYGDVAEEYKKKTKVIKGQEPRADVILS